ncbi:MAG: transposase [Armatimonadetes bacterium]|nr:transposase [Armatimonadota bacterium]
MGNLLFYREFYRRNLPHYQPEKGIFFITTRLAFTLPEVILNELKEKKEMFEKALKNVNKKDMKEFIREFHKSYFVKFDEFLDKYNKSPMWLCKLEVAKIIEENLHHWNGKRYLLFAYCIMPNHVHIMLKPLKTGNNVYESLTKIMFGIKSYTANECNKVLRRSGQFWHHESYDHFVRDAEELGREIDYIAKNPVKAGLVSNWQDWRYSWIRKNWEDLEM